MCLLILFGMGVFHPPGVVRADEIHPAPAEQVSAYDLILAMNTLRVAYGLPALIEDPIVNAVAQSTAATMAANNMSWHIGDVRGRSPPRIWRRRHRVGDRKLCRQRRRHGHR